MHVKEYIRFGFPDKIHSSLNIFKNNLHGLSLLNGCIMFRNRVFIPSKLRPKLLQQFHVGHPANEIHCALVNMVILV